MEEGDGNGTAAAEKGATSTTTTSVEKAGERLRFTVELRPGETTIVSWKKLLKDANVTPPNGHRPGPAQDPTGAAASSSSVRLNDNPHHRFPPGQVVENEGKDGAPLNRLNTVIERIERLYVANSDEEDNNDVVPDDDEYDTDDSFIDDTELDEYFEVDDSAIKHDGFFVNRGKLERVERDQLPNEQTKKRRRKDLAKVHDGSDSGHDPSKHAKVRRKTAKSVPLVGGRNESGLAPVIALPNVHGDDTRIQNQTSISEISLKKKSVDAKNADQPPLGVVNGDFVEQEKAIDQQKSGVHTSNSHLNKLKEGSEHSDASNQRSHEKTSYTQSKPVSGKLASNIAGPDQYVQQKEKVSNCERPEVSVAESKNSIQNAKVSHVSKREGSSVRPKSTLLEKAIRDLEKLVAESRPPTGEFQDTDNSSQAIKRRLPPEVKQKLAKVARLAANHGKLSKELINRLMSIVGHLIQLRTLKRNLKIMVNMGLSAKQEKDNRVQVVKKEIAEMIKTRIPFMKSKVLEQQAGTSDDFQEISAEEKEAFKRKYSMDDTLEDKICDLYELYIEGLEEDAGPQVRKLYAELSALWPHGFMDNHGIKRAICRAKDRRKPFIRHKDPEKLKRKMLVRKAEAIRMQSSSLSQPVYIQEKLVPESIDHGLASVNKAVSSSMVSGAGARMPVSSTNGSNMDRPKQEKIKGSASSSADMRAVDTSVTKKIKRKPDTEPGEAQIRPEKLLSSQGDEKHKPQKLQVAATLPKSNLQPAAASSSEQLKLI